MNPFRLIRKPKRLELHALGPDETWFQRCHWLVLLVQELKAEREQLRATNADLLQQVNAGLPLTVTQAEFLALRRELNELHKAKARLDRRVWRLMQVNRSLLDEVNDLRQGLDQAA